ATCEGRDVAEQARDWTISGIQGGGDRRVSQIIERAYFGFWRLDREIVGNARLWVGPEIRSDLLGRAKAHVDVGGDGICIESQLSRPRTIDVGVERRGLHFLLQMCIGDPWNCRNAAAELIGNTQVCCSVVADGPHIDLCRQAKIEDL